MEKLHADTETIEQPISSIDTSMDKTRNQFSIEPADECVQRRRQGHAGCVDCDIPFITKKELKVVFGLEFKFIVFNHNPDQTRSKFHFSY